MFMDTYNTLAHVNYVPTPLVLLKPYKRSDSMSSYGGCGFGGGFALLIVLFILLIIIGCSCFGGGYGGFC